MRKIFFCSLFIGYAGAIPTMAIPNLVLPGNINVASNSTYNNNSEIITDNKNSITDSAIISKQFKKQLPGFNADVRGAIINSGQFKVVRMPKQDTIWNGNTQIVLNLVKSSSSESDAITKSKSIASNSVTNKLSTTNLPDYILLGKVTSITQHEDITPIKYTDKNGPFWG